MNGNDIFLRQLADKIEQRNRGIRGRKKMIKPKKVTMIIGGDEPVQYVIEDVEEHIWVIPNIFQKNGSVTQTCICRPLELHFGRNGEVDYAIHQEEEKKVMFAHQ